MEQSYVSLRDCPICKKRSSLILGRMKYDLFDNLNMPGTKTLVSCNKCGMMYDDTAFTEEQLQEYYRLNEHCNLPGRGGSGGSMNDENLRYNRIIDTLGTVNDGIVLDFGCGQGGFLAQCLNRGFCAAGIEPSAKNREVAGKTGLDVYESMDAFIDENGSSKIRAVVFSHVLEHLMHPLHIVRVIAQYAENASVYIEVPDAASYLSVDSPRWQEIYFEHICHFRKHDLAELARRAGINILKEERISFSKSQKDTHCLVLVGRFSTIVENVKGSMPPISYCPGPLPSLAAEITLPDNSPLALWGISQYAMLLMGSCPELAARVKRLFDASPGKIGRSINGIIIESANKLSTLSDEVTLLIPKSIYLEQMQSQLLDSGFNGAVQVI